MRKVHLIGLMALVCVLYLSKTVPAYPQVLTPNEMMVILDANGKFVSSYDVTVFYEEPFAVRILGLTKDKFIGGHRALFESVDCTGTPVLDAEGFFGPSLDLNSLTTQYTIVSQVIPGQDVLGTIYVIDPNSVPHTVNVHSLADNPTGCIQNENYQLMVVDTVEFMDLDAFFTPPFKVTVVSEGRKGKGPKNK